MVPGPICDCPCGVRGVGYRKPLRHRRCRRAGPPCLADCISYRICSKGQKEQAELGFLREVVLLAGLGSASCVECPPGLKADPWTTCFHQGSPLPNLTIA